MECVKQGWSWPAFFFGGWWALTKRIWFFGAAWVVGGLAINGVLGALEEGGVDTWPLPFVVSFAYMAISVYPGLHGNEWKEERLVERGFEYTITINAPTQEAALAVYMKRST